MYQVRTIILYYIVIVVVVYNCGIYLKPYSIFYYIYFVNVWIQDSKDGNAQCNVMLDLGRSLHVVVDYLEFERLKDFPIIKLKHLNIIFYLMITMQ